MAERSPEQFIVRIAGPNGRAAGMGVLIGERRVITCAHVVNLALGLESRSQARPEAATVTIDFPLLAATGPPIRADVDRWFPPPREGAAGDDLATLYLTSAPPSEAHPARLIINPPAAGREVRVYGYPGDPPRPDGAWVPATVRGRVGGGRLQLDSGPAAALRIQPGYSGSPVYDDAAGRVVGLLATAAAGRTAERDSYAIGTEAMRRVESAYPTAAVTTGGHQIQLKREELTILHVSDPQFGGGQLFGGNGMTDADRDRDSVFTRLHDDLDRLSADLGLRPDLMIVTGDLAGCGLRTEFEHVTEFLERLTEAAGLPRQHVAIVPGNHDVNRMACQAYFAEQASDEQPPVAPYWPKWRHFAAMFEAFFADVPGATFTPDEPWTLFEMPELEVVVAGLNSTIAESHRDGDHYGWVGEPQLRWFADRLADYRSRKWLRLAAVHHNVVGSAELHDENLRDADQLDRLLGWPKLANLVLHGHTHDGRLSRLNSGLAALSTGSAAVNESARPTEPPNQYQLLTVRHDGFTRYARQYVVNQKRWVGDSRISTSGSDWVDQVWETLPDTGSTLAQTTAATATTSPQTPSFGLRLPGYQHQASHEPAQSRTPDDDFLEQVADATRARWPRALVTLRPEGNYLRVSEPLDAGGAEQWPVGITAQTPTAATVKAFIDGVHAQFATADQLVQSRLVYSGAQADETLVTLARRHGVRLLSFVEYQGLLDLAPLVERQNSRLDSDRVYPAGLYVSQRYRMLGGRETAVKSGLLERITDWLGSDEARLVMVLGDFGRGKTALLRQIARTLPEELPGVLPVLVELRSLEKAPTLDGLLAQHLANQGVTDIHLGKLRYMIKSGRLALLFDGFDELELRVGYDNATDYLQTLLTSVRGRAKVVLTSRTQHFLSSEQIRTALGERVESLSASQVVVLEDFSAEQIMQFLTNLYVGDAERAQARFALLGDIEDLLGLARNPRMLAFIAALDEDRLRAVQTEQGRISAAELYREIVDFWLIGEANRQRHRGGLPSLDETERLTACTALALRLWSSTAPTIAATDLTTEVATRLTRLADRGYSAEQAGHAIGSGSLLVRTEDGGFSFVHQSIMEWLVAEAAAQLLHNPHRQPLPDTRQMSRLMVDFFIDLAGRDVALNWATRVLSDANSGEIVKKNAMAITNRVPNIPYGASTVRQILAGIDLRGQDLTRKSFREADLTGANLHGMRLLDVDFTNAKLTGCDFGGARLVGGSLRGALLTGSTWDQAALLGVDGVNDPLIWPELSGAAIAARDRAEMMIRPSGFPSDLSFSACGRLLAVARSNVVEIVDAATNQTLRVLSGQERNAQAVAFSLDGTLVNAVFADLQVITWQVATGTEHNAFTTLAEHEDSALGVAFSAQGTQIAIPDEDGSVFVWDIATGTVRGIRSTHEDVAKAVAFSPDGGLIATGSYDGAVRIWEISTSLLQRTLPHLTELVTAVAFSPDGSLIATVSSDVTTRIWDAETGALRVTFKQTGRSHSFRSQNLAFSPDGALVATAFDGNSVIVWDVAAGTEHMTLKGHTGWIQAIEFSPDAKSIATASGDGSVRIWDLAHGTEPVTLAAHKVAVGDVSFSPDGTSIAITYTDLPARIWDFGAGTTRALIENSATTFDAVAFSSNHSLLATAAADLVQIWNVATGVEQSRIDAHTARVHKLAFSPDSKLIAIATDLTVQIWNPATGAPGTTLPRHEQAITAIAFSADGTLIATSTQESVVQIWNTTTAIPQAALQNTRDMGIRDIAFSPAGTLIATASGDMNDQIWDAATGAARTTVDNRGRGTQRVAFSPDGAKIATASNDGYAKIWDTADGTLLTTLKGHIDAVTTVTFSPDGNVIATASDDATVRVWDANSGKQISMLFSSRSGGTAAVLPDGSYTLDDVTSEELWWAIKLCRFDPGELDPYDPTIRRRTGEPHLRDES